MRHAVFFVLVVLGAGCRGLLAGTTFSKDAVAYRVVTPNDGKGWRRVDFADNDLAWLANETGHVVAINATCSDHDDPQLDVLTKHLVMGFTEREWLSQTPFTLDGRDALASYSPAAHRKLCPCRCWMCRRVLLRLARHP